MKTYLKFGAIVIAAIFIAWKLTAGSTKSGTLH